MFGDLRRKIAVNFDDLEETILASKTMDLLI